ncbi:MAG: phospholipid carrier-dependent glycosyltransferase [Bryobacteraceae bacterium]|jgi:4-amino-4-deoxy-L-arabinose transferase-like glycosyltransferase
MKKRAKVETVRAAVRDSPLKVAPAGYWNVFESFLARRATWLAVGLVALASARIVSTYTIFSHTFDEPAHIACGMEWLEKHTYTYEPQHPPLTRVMTALLPKLFGAHGANQELMWDEGLAILFSRGTEDFNLALARLGILPFFWITCWIAYSCTRWISGSAAAAVLAVFLVSMTPTILAHAGLATTDMGLTAMLLLAIYSGWRWMEERVWWRAAAFGASTGLAVLSKFSMLAFFPSIAVVALLIWLGFEYKRLKLLPALLLERLPQALVAAAIAAVVIWAGYFFSFGKTVDFTFPVPAPELFSGIDEVKKHNATGHTTYLMGAVNNTGWPQFYAVALAVKTPLPILALGILGLALLFSRKQFGTRGWMVLSVVLGILIFSSFFSQIRIGTRHVLPVFVAFGIAGGCAAVWLAQLPKRRGLAQGLVALTLLLVAATSLAAHPNYLAYFNVIAGGKPEAFLVDSDLDWCQDTKRLAKKLKELGATEIYFNKFAPGDPEKLYGLPLIHPLDVNGARPGWNVVGLTALKLGLFGDTRYAYDPGFQFWPETSPPTERVGNSYWLFYSDAGGK